MHVVFVFIYMCVCICYLILAVSDCSDNNLTNANTVDFLVVLKMAWLFVLLFIVIGRTLSIITP